ncbi:hypothetical protein QFC21_004882 [Naganishia friedmannii]|uniref:Uncharacterized protein n=1 Tax=Naganishia friedmannii TaxID=89922 RepID=A0ACC2VDM0_9TREE|nr:hypothetical protein QFC21_004882 [Naganishia friedmannii]
MSDSDSDSIPDPEINFALVYAFHTFVATVDGQASVMRGDSLVLLDDANSYWWLVRVLKTDEVGYIPAENVETPWERLARLNKWRNVELGHATTDEMADAMTYEQRNINVNISNGLLSRFDPRDSSFSFSSSRDRASSASPSGVIHRRKSVVFAPPTYVDHPGITWSDESDADDEQGLVEDELAQEGEEESDDGSDNGDNEDDGAEPRDITHVAARVAASPEIHATATHHQSFAAEVETTPLDDMPQSEFVTPDMEPDDGIAWSDAAAQESQQQRTAPPLAPAEQVKQPATGGKYGALGVARGPSTVTAAISPVAAARESTPDDIMDALRPSPLVNQRASAIPAPQQRSVPSPSPSQQSRVASATSQVSAYSLASTTTTTTTSDSIRSDSGSPDLTSDAAGRKGKKEAGVRKKRSGVFSGLFKKKEKKDKNAPSGEQGKPVDGGEMRARGSDESFMNRPQTTKSVLTPRSPLSAASPRPDRPAITLSTPDPSTPTNNTPLGPSSPAAISPHALRLQQMDQQQHKRYQEYMARSPSNDQLDQPASKAYGTQAAAAVASSYAAQRLTAASGGDGSRDVTPTKSHPGFLPNGRPGSLMLPVTGGAAPALRTAGGELTVLRVFVGDTVVSENTFKTVLTNETTSAKRLAQQAVQRLQLPTEDEYFLVIKQVEGGEIELMDDEKVMERFFALNGNSEDDGAPIVGTVMGKTVRRSSIGSISSISSNLSQHPAISRLAMNDFSDDSSVKLFLHRRPPAPEVSVQEADMSMTSEESGLMTPTRNKPFPHLTVTTTANSSPNSLAAASPTPRFSMRIVISAHDLPDGMTFDPNSSESIVSKSWLSQHRAGHQRDAREADREIHKLLLIPRNATVAEVIEAGLERLGIVGGVVAGGDDVEDKISKRRSVMRIKYGLVARFPGQLEEIPLQPNHKVLDAYREPPVFKHTQMSKEMRRRSREFPGASQDDIQPTDPVLVLRRVPTNLPDSPKIALDEVEVRRKRISVDTNSSSPGRPGQQTRTTQQIIEEQRALSRAKQHALLSAQENTENGLDVHLPDRGTVRSSRITIDGEEHVRYSYISVDGETIDISQQVQNELVTEDKATSDNDPEETLLSPTIPGLYRQPTDQSIYRTAPNTPLLDDESIKGKSVMSLPAPKPDLLQRAIRHSRPDNATDIANKLDRIISMATSFHADNDDMDRLTPLPFERTPASPALSSATFLSRAASPSESEIGRGLTRDATLSPMLGSAPASIKQAMELPSRMPQGHGTAKHTAVQPQSRFVPRAKHQRQQPSIASILSDISATNPHSSSTATSSFSPIMVDSPTPPFGTMSAATEALRKPLDKPRRPIKHTDDFGFTTMMHVIQARADKMHAASQAPSATADTSEQNEVERRYLDKDTSNGRRIAAPVHKRFSSIDQKLEEQERELSALMEGVLAFALETSGKRAATRG